MIISKSPIIKIPRIIKFTSVSTCPPVVLRDPETTPINVEYEIQHSHIRLSIPDRSCASLQVPANKLAYETHPSCYTTNKIPV